MKKRLATIWFTCALSACVTPSRNYAGHFGQIPLPEANLGPETSDTVPAAKIFELNKSCADKQVALDSIINKADDRRTLYNKINGGITGLLGGIGTIGTMASGLTANVGMGSDGQLAINDSDKTRTAVIGGVTAGVTLVGVVLTAYLDLGVAQKGRAVDEKSKVASTIDEYTAKCASTPNVAKCAELRGKIESMCALSNKQ